MNMKERMKKDFNMMTILLIPIAIAINVVGGRIAATLKLPVYLDCIGVILLAMIAGPLVGMTTGLLSNLVLGLFDPFIIVYAPTSMALGLVVGWLSKKGMFTKVWKGAIGAVISALVSTLVSSPVTAFAFGGITAAGASLVTAAFLTAGQSMLAAVFSSTLVVDVIDKGISIIVAMLIIRAIPAKTLIKLANGSMYIKNKK